MMPADEYTIVQHPVIGCWHIVAHYGSVARVLEGAYDTRGLAQVAALQLQARDDVARLSGPQTVTEGR